MIVTIITSYMIDRNTGLRSLWYILARVDLVDLKVGLSGQSKWIRQNT